jgi:tryptophan-rich sensory protein
MRSSGLAIAATWSGLAIAATWTGLYGLLAYGGYRLMVAPRSRDRTLALACWGATTAGIAVWPRLFFGLKSLGASLAGIVLLLGTATAATLAGWRVDRIAAAAISPLIGWIGYASVINEEIWRRD